MKSNGAVILSLLVLALGFVSCGGGSSAQVQTPPPPPSPSPASEASITSISPTSAVTGSPDLTLSIMGSGFVNQRHNICQVEWIAKRRKGNFFGYNLR